MKKLLTLIALFSFAALPVRAGRETFNISEELDKRIQDGLYELYNFNFEEANAIFRELEPQAKEHPMVSFGLASSEWWRVSALVLEPDEKESAPFIKAVNECINNAEAMVKRGDKTGEGNLVLGGAQGLYGRWEATNGQWVSAYFRGKKAIKYLEQALKINPEMHDAKMGLGMFDYIIATLPTVVRKLAFIGKGGNKQVGLDELAEASEKGTYARTPSRLFLCQIYAQSEKKPERALEILAKLRADYPRSPFMHMMEIISLYNSAQMERLKAESDDFVKKFEDGIYPKLYVAQAYFSQGAYAFKSKDWATALERFQQTTTAEYEKDPWKTWAHLYAGYCLDAQNKREEAKKEYQIVLKAQRRWGSHDAAKEHLKKPFKGTDEELKMLEL